MPIVDKSVLKSYFNDGDVPNESNYIDLIDTMSSEEVYSYAVPAAGWYRIAQGATGNNVGIFRIVYVRSGVHTSIIFTVSISFNQSPKINILTNSPYNGGSIDNIRLVYFGTYDLPAVEIYADSAGTVHLELLGSHGWTLLSTITTGEIPVGWTSLNFVPTGRYGPDADTVPWTGIAGKPTTFPPEAHTQDWTTITGKPATYPPSAHLHDSDYHRKDAAIINSFDGRLGGGLYVGSTAIDPATGTIVSTDFMAALGGLHVGGVSDPGTDVLIVDDDSKIGGGLVVGDTTINPNTGAIIYTENLSPKRGTMTHVGYVFVPLTESMTNAANWIESSRGIGTHQVDVSTFHGIVTTSSLLDAVVGGTGNVKAWQLRLLGRWTSAGSNNYAVARGRSPYTNSYGPGLAAQVANINIESDGIIIADSSGDFSIVIGGSTAIITLQITGYYI